MDIKLFFDKLWQDYVAITPQAAAIRELFLLTDTHVVNDHVAFRTFSSTAIDREALEGVILSMGYQLQDHYAFVEKKLAASSYIHPDSEIPKIFLSELERHKLSAQAQAILTPYCEQITEPTLSPAVFWSGRHWSMPTLSDYQALKDESEYAAWLLVMGLRANHFTLCVNRLDSVDGIEQVLDRVEREGYVINSNGGRVKGSAVTGLEQGATMADSLAVRFAGGELHSVASGFYEFARRYRDKTGELYQGFVTANADKIFESTTVK